MKAEIPIVIADNHPIFLQGLRRIIEADPSLRIVAEAADGEAALARVKEGRPQVAVLDISMPGLTGFEVARAIRERRLPTEVVFLTMYDDERHFNAALDAGVKGYVIKDSAVTEIVQAIKTVSAGRNYISPQLSTFLIDRHRRADALSRQTPAVQSLTPTERRVLQMLAEYKTSKEIADELCISARTVHHHRANIAEKLGLHGSHALMKFAIEHQSDL